MEELCAADQKIQRALLGIMLSLDDDEFGSCWKKSLGSSHDVSLPGRDEQGNGRILQMVGREDETTMAEVPIV